MVLSNNFFPPRKSNLVVLFILVKEECSVKTKSTIRLVLCSSRPTNQIAVILYVSNNFVYYCFHFHQVWMQSSSPHLIFMLSLGWEPAKLARKKQNPHNQPQSFQISFWHFYMLLSERELRNSFFWYLFIFLNPYRKYLLLEIPGKVTLKKWTSFN